MLGGVSIGLIEAFWSGYFTVEYKDVAVFGILVMVLIFRPERSARPAGNREGLTDGGSIAKDTSTARADRLAHGHEEGLLAGFVALMLTIILIGFKTVPAAGGLAIETRFIDVGIAVVADRLRAHRRWCSCARGHRWPRCRVPSFSLLPASSSRCPPCS